MENKLQQLLDEKWPLENNLSESDRLYKIQRNAFSEGYNAGKEEEKAVIGNEIYDTKLVRSECRKMIADGNPLSALRLYKTTMGGSLNDAKAILNL